MSEKMGAASSHDGPPFVDHTGREFPTKAAMCQAWGINPRAFTTRRRLGWDLERALTESVGASQMYSVRDHEGREHASVKAMCRYWEIPEPAYRARIAAGWDMGRALTEPTAEKHLRCTDHEGTEYDSVIDMCHAWGVTRGAYNKRLEAGWTVEEALTTPLRKRMEPVDHKGTRYPSIEAMCRAWGVSANTFRRRIQYGWDVEKALTAKVRGAAGREMETVQEAAQRMQELAATESRRAPRLRRGRDVQEDSPAALKAEYRAMREQLGISRRMMGDALSIGSRTLREWEAENNDKIPVDDAWDLLDDAWDEQHDYVAAAVKEVEDDLEAGRPVTIGYWTGERAYRNADGDHEIWGLAGWQVENASARAFASVVDLHGCEIIWRPL